jgi:hypothetical protein
VVIGDLLWNTIDTVRTSTRDTRIYPVVRPSTKLAYSTLWHPNGRGLHSTPLKWSNDRLEYHGVLLSLLFLACEESPQLGVSHPYNKNQSESTRVREGSNTLKSTANPHTHTAKNWAQMSIPKFTTRTELKSLRMSNECTKSKCEWSRMLKVCLVSSSMRLGVPFIAPRQLGAVENTVRCGFLSYSSAADRWRFGAVGAPDTVRCTPDSPVPPSNRWPGHASRADCAADRWLTGQFGAHRTVRWILVVHRRRIPESGLFTRASLAHRTLSGAPRLSKVLAAWAKSFPIVFFLILALRQIC